MDFDEGEPGRRAQARRNSSAVTAQLERDIAQDEALRSLLSYLKTEAEKFDPDQMIDEFNPYDDAAYKLAAILDGEQ